MERVMPKPNWERNYTVVPKYYVFYDIDGVLTSLRQEIASNHNYQLWSKFDPVAIEFFNKIHDNYKDVQFVCISTWRNHMELDANMEIWVASALNNAGFRGFINWDEWKVNKENDHELWRKNRAYEIKEFLKGKNHKDFIIFDDTDYNFHNVLGIKRFVKTDERDGILSKHMLNAMSIMGTWEKK